MNLILKTAWFGAATNAVELRVEVSSTELAMTLDKDIKDALVEVLQSAAEEQFKRRFVAKDTLGKLSERDVAGVLAAGENLPPGTVETVGEADSSAGDPPAFEDNMAMSAPSHQQMDNMMRLLGTQIAKEQK